MNVFRPLERHWTGWEDYSGAERTRASVLSHINGDGLSKVPVCFCEDVSGLATHNRKTI